MRPAITCARTSAINQSISTNPKGESNMARRNSTSRRRTGSSHRWLSGLSHFASRNWQSLFEPMGRTTAPSRKNSPANRHCRKVRMERLEDRRLLTGDLMASLDGFGNLVLSDLISANDQLLITGASGDVQVTNLNGGPIDSTVGTGDGTDTILVSGELQRPYHHQHRRRE